MIDTFFIHPVDELAKLRISTAFTAHKMATEDLLMKFDKLVGEFNEIIKEERGKMMAGVQAYKAEKETMEAFVVNDDDIIDLNIGGQKLSTTRSTLCQVEGSLLVSMFSGRWEDGLKRDKDGAVFFDFNPQHFALILDYLRQRKIASAQNPAPLPKVSDDQLQSFTNLLEYLGLNDEIGRTSTETFPSEKFDLYGPNVALQEGGKVAVHDGTRRYGYVLGDNVYHQGTVNIKLKLESFENNDCMSFGIIRGDVIPVHIRRKTVRVNGLVHTAGNSGLTMLQCGKLGYVQQIMF